MLHVISARCVARDLHTIAHGPLERTCWRQFAAPQEDCNKSRTAPLKAINIIISRSDKCPCGTGPHLLHLDDILFKVKVVCEIKSFESIFSQT